MILSAYRLLSSECKGYVEYAVKMAIMVVAGVCLCFVFASLLLLSVEEAPLVPDEAGAARGALRHAWEQYRLHSWGANELAPDTLSPSRAADPLVGSHSGLTIVESLEPLHLMGLTKEFQQAEAWVAKSFNFTNVSTPVSTADASAKLLGGLLSAFSFSEKPLFLFKALQVAEGLLAAFETPSGLPVPMVVPFDAPALTGPTAARQVSLGQMSRLYLEFAFLHRLTGLQKYADVGRRILAPLARHLRRSGAGEENVTTADDGTGFAAAEDGRRSRPPWSPPSVWDTWTGEPPRPTPAPSLQPSPPSLSSSAPSATGDQLQSVSGSLALAEVAIKAHLLVDDREALRLFQALLVGRLNLDAWLGCRADAGKKLDAGSGCRFSLDGCRLVETLLLSMGQSRDPIAQRDLAYRLGDLCSDAMRVNSLHLTPDSLLLKSTQSGALVAKEADQHYAAKPGPVLAGLLMWSRRRRPHHRQLLGNALRSISQHLRSPGGFQGFTHSPREPARADNRQPSYLLSQTLKFIYMAFEPSRLNLVGGDWLSNTEGHLLPVSNGLQFSRLRAVVRANWPQVRQLLSDLERLRIGRRKGQVESAATAAEAATVRFSLVAAAAAVALTLIFLPYR